MRERLQWSPLLDKAVNQLSPTKRRIAVVRYEVYRVALLVKIAAGIDKRAKPPRAVQTSLKKLVTALRKVEFAANNLPFPYFLWPNFLERVKKERKSIESCINNIVVRPGSRRKSQAKENAVALAYKMLLKFEKRPTLTKNGRWPKLANILFENAVGSRADLYEQCRDYNDRLQHRGRKPRR
jgi:hypothetical protein